MQQLADLSHALQSVVACLMLLRGTKGARVSVGVVSDDVVGLGTPVIDSAHFGTLGHPGGLRDTVFLEWGLLDDLVENALEGSRFLLAVLLTNVVCGINRESLDLDASGHSIELSVSAESHLVGALGGPMGHFAFGYLCIRALARDSAHPRFSVFVKAALLDDEASIVGLHVNA